MTTATRFLSLLFCALALAPALAHLLDSHAASAVLNLIALIAAIVSVLAGRKA